MSFIGAAIGGIASLAGGLISGNAAQQGAEAQAAAMTYAANLQHQQYLQNVGYETPYMNAGTNALGMYGNYLGLNGTGAQQTAMAGYQNSPFFQQMQKNAGDTTMAQYAGQGQMGGNALNALYQQNAGMNYQQYNNYLGQLSGVSQQGLSATNALAGAGTQAAATQGQLIAGAGAAQGAGIMGAGNALGSSLNNAGIFGMLGYNAFNQQNPGWSTNLMGGA